MDALLELQWQLQLSEIETDSRLTTLEDSLTNQPSRFNLLFISPSIEQNSKKTAQKCPQFI